MTRLNPYIGPRAFGRDDKRFFHGRDGDIERLLNLLIAERIVLLHALSGAGKTSLINAALVPELEEEGFEVLPVMRVNRLLPEEIIKDIPNTNRYIFSALLSLARFKDYSEAHDMTPEERNKIKKLAGTKFSEYLDEVEKHLFAKKLRVRLAIKQALQKFDEEAIPSLLKMTSEEAKAYTNLNDDEVKILQKLQSSELKYLRSAPEEDIEKQLEADSIVLIFDQFEEVLSADPTDNEAKLKFFEEVGAALYDDTRWALFSMREDYVASLGSLLRPVPTRLNTRFKLELLSRSSAREAIELPAGESGVSFEPEAVDKLVDDLRTVKVQRLDGVTTNQQGEHCEPMQLQVVCFRLWEKLQLSVNENKTQIKLEDLKDIQVDQTLAEFYEDTLESVTETFPTEDEGKIRQWVQNTLITPGDTRGTVFMGSEQAGGMSRKVVEHLAQRHLLRSEQRAGARWYELTHDRFIEPIKKSNRPWLALQAQLKKARTAHAVAIAWFILLALTWLFVEFVVTEPLREARAYYKHKAVLSYVFDSTTKNSQLVADATTACKEGSESKLAAVNNAIGERRKEINKRPQGPQESSREVRLEKKDEQLELDRLTTITKTTFDRCKAEDYPTINQAMEDLRSARNTKGGWVEFELTPEKVKALEKIVPNSMSTHRETSAYNGSARPSATRGVGPAVVAPTPSPTPHPSPSITGEKRDDSRPFDINKGRGSLARIGHASRANSSNQTIKLQKDEIRNLEAGFNVLVDKTMETTGLLTLKNRFAERAESVSLELRSIETNRPQLSKASSTEARKDEDKCTLDEPIPSEITTKYKRLFLSYTSPPDEIIFTLYLIWCGLLMGFMMYLTPALQNVEKGIAAFDLLRSKGLTDPLGWAFIAPFPPVIAIVAVSCLIVIHIRLSLLCYEILKTQLGRSAWATLLIIATIGSFGFYIGIHYFLYRTKSAKAD